MSAPDRKKLLIQGTIETAKRILQGTGNLDREDLEYVVQKVATLKDERLKACIAELIRWSDDDRAEIETIVALGIEAMKELNPSKMIKIARIVELRSYLR